MTDVPSRGGHTAGPGLLPCGILVVASGKADGADVAVVLGVSADGTETRSWSAPHPDIRSSAPMVTLPADLAVRDWPEVHREVAEFTAGLGTTFVHSSSAGVRWVRDHFSEHNRAVHLADLGALARVLAADVPTTFPDTLGAAFPFALLGDHAVTVLSHCLGSLSLPSDHEEAARCVVQVIAALGDRNMESLARFDLERRLASDAISPTSDLSTIQVQRAITESVRRSTTRYPDRPPPACPLVPVLAGRVTESFEELARSSEAVTRRDAQERFSELASGTFSSGSIAAVEAGTGTGKTLGYLVAGCEFVLANPGSHLVVATSTRALREQVTREAASVTAHGRFQTLRVGGYKAKSDYVCARRLADGFVAMMGSMREPSDQGQASRWLLGFTYALRTGGEALRGEWSGCVGDECKGGCPHSICRDAALSADVVVTTHSSLALLARDPAHSEWRAAAVCVVDEADQFPKNVRLALRTTFRLEDLGWVVSDMGQYGAHGPAAKAIRALVWGVDEMLDAEDFGRRRWSSLGRRSDVQRSLRETTGELREARLRVLSARRSEQEANPGSLRDMLLGRLLRGIDRVAGEIETVSTEYDGRELLHTVARQEGELYFAREPFVLGALEGGPLPDFHSVLYTSATLPDGDPSPFLNEVGAPEDAELHRVKSPFDYDEMVSAAVVTDLPAYRFSASRIAEEARVAAVAEAVSVVARALGGRTLVLSTSAHERDELASRVKGSLQGDGLRMLVQRAGQGDVVEDFQRSGGRGCVLFGVDTLWTGLDLPGPALSAVVVPKLPFPNPESAEAYQERELDWPSYQAQYASNTAIKLRQGLGRLVRTPNDRGLFVVLDPRADNPDRLRYLNESLGVVLTRVGSSGLEDWAREEATKHGLVQTDP